MDKVNCTRAHHYSPPKKPTHPRRRRYKGKGTIKRVGEQSEQAWHLYHTTHSEVHESMHPNLRLLQPHPIRTLANKLVSPSSQ